MVGCTLFSALFGAAVAGVVWSDAGPLWAFLAYAVSGSIALLSVAFLQITQRAPRPEPPCAGGRSDRPGDTVASPDSVPLSRRLRQS